MSNPVANVVKPVLKKAYLGYLNTRQSIVGTSVGFTHYGYALVRSLAMSFYTPANFKEQNRDPRAVQLKEEGFVTMPDFYAPQLMQKIHNEFNQAMDNDALIVRNKYSTTLKSSIDFNKHVPSLFELLQNKELRSILHSFYGTCYTLTIISGTRLFHIPENERNPENMLSAIWHCDNIPTDTVHLAVFLQDTTPQYGPTQLVSIERTKQLMRMGYGQRHAIGLPIGELENPQYVKDLSSKLGTAHLMLPCQSLHRAGVPEKGLIRDSLFFSFRPGLEPTVKEQLKPVSRKIYEYMESISKNR